MNEFTKGCWTAVNDHPDVKEIFHIYSKGDHDNDGIEYRKEIATTYTQDSGADAGLIAAAGTSANKLAEMGYDAQKVMELLPRVVDALSDIHNDAKSEFAMYEASATGCEISSIFEQVEL